MKIPKDILPTNLQDYIKTMSHNDVENIEEIRFHKQGNITIKSRSKLHTLNEKCTFEYLDSYINKLLKYSYHCYEDSIKQGYITLDNGVRVGICGKISIKEGKVYSMNNISSINLRFAKEIIGCSNKIIKSIQNGQGVKSTLIISPPGCGKTTLLRDICRNLSNSGLQVSVCDERSEICGMNGGISNFDIGSNTDVLDACPKSIGMSMLLRSMSPNVIITDEIGSLADVMCIKECLKSGVSVITSIHGSNSNDILKKDNVSQLISEKLVEHIITLSKNPTVGTVVQNYDL